MLCDIDTLRTEHEDFRERLDQLEGQFDILHKGGSSDYYAMLELIDYMTPGKDGSHHCNEALLFQQLRRRTGRRWLVVEVLKRRRQIVGIQRAKLVHSLHAVVNDAIIPRASLESSARAYIAGLREQIALEEGAVFPVASALLLDEDWLALDSAAAKTSLVSAQ